MPRSQGTSRKGKPKKGERAAGMGRALERSQLKRFKPKSNGSSRHGAGMAASGARSIGIHEDPANKKILSVLEMDDLTDFLTQAEMADREFASEKERFVVLDSTGTEFRFDQEAERHRRDDFAFQELSVPRRPAWTSETTRDELDRAEKEAFLEWRRAVAQREEELLSTGGAMVGGTTVTPFEKNLEVWRQLWRVLERSAVVVQIVDARNPLFYLSKDLRRYAADELGKPMLIIVNKSDYLTERQRAAWNEYFRERDIDHLFFSAYDEQRKLDEAATVARREERLEHDIDGVEGGGEEIEDERSREAADGEKEHPLEKASFAAASSLKADALGVTVPLTREQLLDALQSFASRHDCKPDARYENRVQFGMVGFPNVGKSSVINVLVGSSKHAHGVVRVAVAAQPGKTKHFQTLLLPDRPDMMLCDCPGLVFPSFVSSTADLIAAGVYPIAQMRDHWPVVNLICMRIPRKILEGHYGIKLPAPSLQDLRESGLTGSQVDDVNVCCGSTVTGASGTALPPPTAEELLGTYCVARSILAPASGVPDYQRASRVVIKDYTEGKLLYCHAPPNLQDVKGVHRMGTADFYRETLFTAFRNTRKLREKLGAILEQSNAAVENEKGDVGDLDEPGGARDDALDVGEFNGLGVEDDLDILEMVGGFAEEDGAKDRPNGGKRGKAHKSMKKHGKKGRKDRNKDPYGCHSEPDATLGGGVAGKGGGKGVIVNAGKYGSSGYTRANYSGARAAMPFEGKTTRRKRG